MSGSVSSLPWTGNKGCIYTTIDAFMPPHKTYVEACMGSAEVFLRKRPVEREIINDFNGDLVRFFRVLQRNENLQKLIGRLYLSFNSEQIFRANNDARELVENARAQVAQLMGVKRDEVFFTSGATESSNIAILGLVEHACKTNKKHIITTSVEHKAVLEATKYLQSTGFDVDYISPGESGRISLEQIVEKVRDDTLLVSVMHAEGEMLLHRMDLKGICISTGSACDSSRTQISHVLQAMDIPDNYAKGTIRISLGEENTHDDVVTIARALSSILRKQTKS